MKLLRLLPLSLLLCALVRAQGTTAPAAPAAPAAAAVAAPAKPTVESVEKLLDVMKVQAMMGPLMNQMHAATSQMLADPSVSGGMSEADKAEFNKFQDKLWVEMGKAMSWDNLKQLYIETYQEVFCQAEIDALTAFYSTPAGSSIMGKMPQAMGVSMQKMRAKVIPMMQKMMADLKGEADSLKQADAAAKAAPAPAAPAADAAAKPAGA